ncbi:MAG: di-heme oxidoredictase family protein [Pseudomonadota bacterium]
MIRVVVCTVFSLLIACGGGSSGGSSEGGGSNSESFRIEHLSAGDATVQSTGLSAFSQPSSNLSGVQDQLSFNRGDHFFEKKFGVGDGLGPLFNNTSCQGCHVNDGRGHASREAAPDNGLDFDSLLIKTFKSQLTETQKDEMKMGRLSSVGDSQVGVQLQNKSIEGVPAESELRVSYEPVFVTFKDGERVTLRKPIWHVNYLGDGMLDDDTVFSIRVAPPMIGLGMLEAINERDIRSREDPNDLNNDGISGRSNVVINQETNALELGRFGWKAGLPTLRAQTAVAFNHDMGLTTFIIPKGNCLPHQVACNAEKQVVKESEFEVSLSSFDDVVFYSRNLAVPARRNAYDQSIQAGKALFNKVGCGSCHVAQYKTIRTSHFAQ